MLSFQCDNIHIFRAQQSCLASGCQTGQDRLRASAEGEDSLYLEEVSCPCPPAHHPTFSPSLPLSGVTLLYISFPTEYTGQACDGKDPDNSRAWRSWAGERQGSGQNRCKCASPLTIPGGDKGPKGQLNMSVTHLAPNSEDTICSGPETPQGLTEELWGETGSQKDVHSRATALENGAGAALQTCCVKCWPLGKVSLSTFFSHWSCPGFS